MAGLDLQLNIGGDYVDSGIAVEHGDFAILNGKFQMVAEDDLARQVGQRLHVRLLLHTGEVFFNTSAGFPYTAIGKFKKSNIFDTYMKAYLIATDGVDKLQNYDSSLDNKNRIQNVSFDALINTGETVTQTQEIQV